jgi:hypothetical protein
VIPALGYAGAEKRSFRRGAQAFGFRVNDPNGDQLQFRIRLLPESGAPMELERAWREKFFTFDTLVVPDGRYRLEVTATDAATQPFNAAQNSVWKTPPFVVDHTPPVISGLSAVPEADGLRVRFLARDETSLLKEAALSADGSAWLELVPEDGIFDAREKSFNVLVPADRVKGNRVLVRATDAKNNEQNASVAIGVAKK